MRPGNYDCAAVTGPVQLCVGNGHGLPRSYVAVLSHHDTVAGALRHGRLSGQQGRLFIRATPSKDGQP
jgi:hypothetical protein